MGGPVHIYTWNKQKNTFGACNEKLERGRNQVGNTFI
jgi:hypothetical protein